MKYKAIALWAHPRSLSTVFERMMIERGDFYVFHEPFCTMHDAGKIELKDPGGQLVILNSFEAIADKILEWSVSTNIFLKETFEYKYEVLYRRKDLLQILTHTFIVREPEKTINSHYAMNNNLTFDEIGYSNLLGFYEKLKEEGFTLSDVVDADELIHNTNETIARYCQRTGIHCAPESLSWKTGDIEMWKRTSKWHREVQNSTGIRQSKQQYEVTVSNHSRLKELYEASLPLYKTLKSLQSTCDL